jgi:Ricin-type beta-trefoil lectin domain
MKNKFDHIVLIALGVGLAGCMAEDTTSDPNSDQETSSTESAITTGYHLVLNDAYSQCMGSKKGALNEILSLNICYRTTLNEWSFVPAGPANTFYMVNAANGLCAEVNNGTSTPGERVDEWYCDGLASEQWVQSFRVIAGQVYSQFRHAGTNQCLDTVGSGGSQLMQWTCDANNNAQTWLVE